MPAAVFRLKNNVRLAYAELGLVKDETQRVQIRARIRPESHVRNLDSPVPSNEDILRIQIPDDSQFVGRLETIHNLPRNATGTYPLDTRLHFR